jgi:hypothetical protein
VIWLVSLLVDDERASGPIAETDSVRSVEAYFKEGLEDDFESGAMQIVVASGVASVNLFALLQQYRATHDGEGNHLHVGLGGDRFDDKGNYYPAGG